MSRIGWFLHLVSHFSLCSSTYCVLRLHEYLKNIRVLRFIDPAQLLYDEGKV